MIKRLAVIFCAVALAVFTACGGPKAADGAPSEMSKAVDDMMQSDGFNAVGSVTDSLKAGEILHLHEKPPFIYYSLCLRKGVCENKLIILQIFFLIVLYSHT